MKKKVLLASSIGNALEFFDFTLYGAFISIIAENFFPAENKTSSLLMTLGVFGVGFIMRPFGALFFGYFGDLLGRKKALSYAVFLMGLPTFMIGVLPSYDQMGILSSFIILAGRLIQGLCLGGEYNGAAIFAIEHSQKKPGLTGGIITGSCVAGAFLATASGALTQLPGFPDWTWRIPFLLGAVVSILGYYICKSLLESPDFINDASKSTVPLLEMIFARKRSCLLSFCFGGLNGALSYTLFAFLNIYLSRYLNFSLSQAMEINLFGLLAFMIGSPLLGMIYDKFPNFSCLRSIGYTLFFALIPIFWLLLTGIYPLVVLGQILLGLCTASIAGTGHAVMQKLFPVKERYRGISFCFSLGVGIFGGLAPIIYVDAIEVYKESLYFPAFFLMFLVSLFYGALKISKAFNIKRRSIKWGYNHNSY